MKQIILLLILVCPVAAQDTVTITIEDLRNFRKAVADAVFWEKTAKDKDEQVAEANKSAANWKGLYLSEKDRADRVQGGRIEEIKDANADLKQANSEYRLQREADRQKIGEQQADIISLKSGRKWYFGAGLVTGAAAGFFGGRQTCGTSIPGLARPDFQPDFRPMGRAIEMPNPLRPAISFLKQ